jgi:hypothetical protein
MQRLCGIAVLLARPFAGAALAVLAGLPLAARAQDLFANAYGDSGYEHAYTLIQTADGGYAFSGPTDSVGAGGYDYWIVKLDAAGAVAWERAYGGAGDDIPNAMVQTLDGGYVLAGRTQSFGAGGWDFWILKVDASGGRVWQRTYGGKQDDMAYSIVQTGNGALIVSGWTASYGAGGFDYWLLKLDASGSSLWQKAYGGTSADWPYASCLTSDEGVVVAGGSVSFGAGDNDVWVLRLDASGNRVWQKAYGGPSDDRAFSVQQTPDGGYVVAGFTRSFGAGDMDFWVLRLDASGGLLWQRTYGGDATDWAFGVHAASEGGYVVVGRTDSFGLGDADAWILKLDESGGVAWQRTFGGGALDYAYSVRETSDGSYLVGGVTGSHGGWYDAMVLKLEPSCLLGGDCGAFTITSVAPDSGAAATTTTTRDPQSTLAVSLAEEPLSFTSEAVRTRVCKYPTLPVPDPLTVHVTLSGGAPVLNWSAPGPGCTVEGYGVYRGSFPVYPYNHDSLTCSVTGSSYTDLASGDCQYYLVVPLNLTLEGSYGTASDGSQIPPAASPCRPQCLLLCP